MKRRILSIALTLCMLLSIVPMSALAVETYGLYIGSFQFDSANLTYTSGDGSATYDPDSNTLTIKDLSLSTEGANVLIESQIPGLTIKIDGTLTLNLLDSKVVNGIDYGKIKTNYGIAVSADTTICGANDSADEDSIIINSQSVGVDDTEYEDGTTRVGIKTMSGAKLTMKDLTVSMTDNSTCDYAGHASMIRAVNTLDISGCKLVADKCQFGVYMDGYVPATIRNTAFAMNLSGTDNSGVNFAPDAKNVMQNCSGSISADYPVYTAGELTVSGSSKLTLVANKMGMVAGQNQDKTPGKLILDNANVEIQSESLGLQAEKGGSITMKSGTVSVTKATYGVQVTKGSSFAMQGGTLTLRGANTTSCVGIKTSGTVTVTGGSLKTENVYSAIQNDSSTALSVTGGEHTLTAATCGYLGDASSELQISNTAKVTINAEVGIQLPASSNSKLTVSGGELNINATGNGIELADGTSTMTLSGGKVNITDNNDSPTITGMICVGNAVFSGAEVTFSNCKIDLQSRNVKNKMTGGKLHLSGYGSGAQFYFGFEMTGGVIDGSANTFGIVAAQGTTTLKGGTINIAAYYPFYLTYGGIVDFAGANVTGNASGNCGLYVAAASDTEVNSYKISDGTVVLTSTEAGANEMYTSIADGYGVWAGVDEASATLVENPTQYILATNKYVRFAEKKAVTLTLENVKEGTSASYLPGESFTYTANDAPSGQHFSHWELTVNGSTTNVGTGTTYSGRMPVGNATLTAVFENCSGGTATCQQKAVCSTCGREYDDLASHKFTAEVEDPKYVKTPATCESEGIYYKSCSVCGESSQGTEFETTFTVSKLGHDWGDWFSNGDDTHSRICSRNENHKETVKHDFSAETAESRYLKTEATCTDAAVYYKSCSVCGASSAGTQSEATFFYGNPLQHQWGAWTSDGNDTHSRICSRDENHKETRAHDFSAEVAEPQYLRTEATEAEAATYYKSCPVCGESSQGTEFEAFFSYGMPLGYNVYYCYCDANGANWQIGEKSANEFTLVTSRSTKWETGWYAVIGDVTIDGRVTVSGDVHLILVDGCTLTVNDGIQVQDNSTESTPNTNALTIYAQSTGDKMGTLTAQTVKDVYEVMGYAGIGGGRDGDSCGTITINGGTVRATGIGGGAGIGGSFGTERGGNGGTITINGGTVIANSDYGAGIGGGLDAYNALSGSSGAITINGGTVIANSDSGAGIGGGFDASNSLSGSNGTITINGGTVTATSTSGVGIGSNENATDGAIIIKGGHVIAQTLAGTDTGKAALNMAPTLDAYTNYYWRTSPEKSFTSSETKPYQYKANGTDDTYVEFSNGHTYVITLDPDFDDGESSTVTTGTDGKLTEAQLTLTRDGYTLVGWFEATEGGDEKVTNQTEFKKNTTIYALWTVNQYTITLNANGGTVEPSSLTTGDGWKLTGALPAPARDGYTFDGWYTEDGDEVTADTVFINNTTIYARWTVNQYTITFDTAGGTEIAPITQGYGTAVTAPKAPTRSGYTFAGWEPEIPDTMPAEDITITATWTKKSSGSSSAPTYPAVVKDADNGTVTVSPRNPEKGDKVTITPKPDAGYEVDEVMVADRNGDPVEIRDNGDGTYTFKQPSGKVTVTVTFKETARDNRIVLTLGSTAATVFGEQVTNDVAPIARNNRTLLPIRFIAEALGATVDWNADLQKVTIAKTDLLIEIYLGQTTAYVGGSPVVLDVAAFAENNRTYLPLRFVAEALGAEVLWDQATQSITIIPA